MPGQQVSLGCTWYLNCTIGWQIYTVSITNEQIGIPNLITAFTQARTQNPTYSPDSSIIAYLYLFHLYLSLIDSRAMDRPGFEADRLHINLYDRNEDSTKELTAKWDRSVSGIVWTNDGSGLLADADEGID